MFVQNLWASKCRNGTKNIHIISILFPFTFKQNSCNYRDVKTMQILCIKHKHSLMSFKNNVLFF
jgi:hypothetical protein